MPKHEIKVQSNRPMPKGYIFLPKGNQYKTLHCRRLTHKAGKPLFIVEEGAKPVGIRVPRFIFFQVQSRACETLSSRRAATEQRDSVVMRQAAAELDKLFPRMPPEARVCVLRHGFKKHSGRVGRTKLIPLSQKVTLAVVAHIRHKHTRYDAMLGSGIDRTEARKMIANALRSTLKSWGAKRTTIENFCACDTSDSETEEDGDDGDSSDVEADS